MPSPQPQTIEEATAQAVQAVNFPRWSGRTVTDGLLQEIRGAVRRHFARVPYARPMRIASLIDRHVRMIPLPGDRVRLVAEVGEIAAKLWADGAYGNAPAN